MATNYQRVDDVKNPIARALIPLLLWLLVLTLPPTGRHRPRPAGARHRAPDRRSDHLLAVQRRRRRRTLWLATVGVDVDRRNIHAGVAR